MDKPREICKICEKDKRNVLRCLGGFLSENACLNLNIGRRNAISIFFGTPTFFAFFTRPTGVSYGRMEQVQFY
jgi:hypothetical protein